MAFHLEIVTPEKTILSETVSSVRLPGAEGEMEALEGHAALVSTLEPGELAYKQDGRETQLAVGSGFTEVSQDRVNVLTDMALDADEIDEAKAEAALKRAEEKLSSMEHDQNAEEIAHMQAVLAKAVAQLNLKRRYRS